MQTRLHLVCERSHQRPALLPGLRVTRVRGLALLSLGLSWAGSVQLGHIAATLPLPVQQPSTVRRFRRWLANRAMLVVAAGQPLARAFLAHRGQRELLRVVDPTPDRDEATLLVLGLVVHRRVLPLAWHIVPEQTAWAHPPAAYLARHCQRVAAVLPPGVTVTRVVDRGLTSAWAGTGCCAGTSMPAKGCTCGSRTAPSRRPGLACRGPGSAGPVRWWRSRRGAGLPPSSPSSGRSALANPGGSCPTVRLGPPARGRIDVGIRSRPSTTTARPAAGTRLVSGGEHADRAQPTQPPAAGAGSGPVVDAPAWAAGGAAGGVAARRSHRPAGWPPGALGPPLVGLAAGPRAVAAPLSFPPPAVDRSLARRKLSRREG